MVTRPRVAGNEVSDALKYIIGFTLAVLAYLWDQHVKSNNEVKKQVEDLEELCEAIQLEQRDFSNKLDTLENRLEEVSESLKSVWEKEK